MKSMGNTLTDSSRDIWRHAVLLFSNYTMSSQRENGLCRHLGPQSRGDTESPSLETSLSKLVSLFCNQEGFTLSVKHRTRGYECVRCMFVCTDQHVYDHLLSNHLQFDKIMYALKRKNGLSFFFDTIPPTIAFPCLILQELDNNLML